MNICIVVPLLLLTLAGMAGGESNEAGESSEGQSPGQVKGYTRHRGYGWGEVTKTQTQLLTIQQAAAQCTKLQSCEKFIVKGTTPETADGRFRTVFLSGKSNLSPNSEWTAYVVDSKEVDSCEDSTQQQSVDQKEQQPSPEDEDEADDDDDDDDDDEDEFDDPSNVPSPESEKLYSEGMTALLAPGDDDVRNVTLAAELFELASNEGHSDAQFMLGLLHSLGLGVRPSEMMAVLYYTFSAMSGNPDAALALSYRYNYGYGVPKSCVDARKNYKIVADKVARSYCQHAISPAVDRIRLSDPVALRTRQKEEDVIQYIQYNADRGDASLQMILGYSYMWGLRGLEQDPAQAEHYFELAAAKGEASAYGALGTIHAQGMLSDNFLQKDYAKAQEYFMKGVAKKHPVSLNGMGYLAMKGKGIKKNYTLAFDYFNQAAQLHNPEALYNLGYLYSKGLGVPRVDKQKATRYLTNAADQGQVLAHWQLGIDYDSSCMASVSHLKTVAEQGKWSKRIEDAHTLYLDGDYSSALLLYLIASEQGYEIAQSNAAYMLDNNMGLEELNFTVNPAFVSPDTSQNVTESEDFARYSLALKYFRKATEQDSVSAMVKVGDYHYYGHGTDLSLDKALVSYTLGSKRSHQAMFNLGYMHENGIHVEQDFHLAKRYYDQAFEASTFAYWPITLALIKLHIRSWIVDSFYSDGKPVPAAGDVGGKTKKPTQPLKFFGHAAEDVLLGTLLLMLFFTLFVRHTARQVAIPAEPAQAPPPPPAEEAPAQEVAPEAAVAAAEPEPVVEEEQPPDDGQVDDATPPPPPATEGDTAE